MNDKVNKLWLSIPRAVDSSDNLSLSDEYDSDIEITSTFDADEHELVRLNELCLDSNDTSDDDIPILNHSTTSNDPVVQLSDDENLIPDLSTENSSTTISSRDTGAVDTPSQKRKRRAWSVREKLRAIENYEKCNNKHSTARDIGCTRFQLSEWLKRKEEFKNLRSSKWGESLIEKSSSFSRIFLE